MSIFVSNAFSLQMLHTLPSERVLLEIADSSVFEVKTELSKVEFMSVFGHEDIARMAGKSIGWEFQANRISVSVSRGDTLFIYQIQGGRLPEGCKILPDGISAKWLRIDIK